MPTISQLPVAGPVSASDEVPISQAGSVCAVSIGTLLASTQPAILIQPPSILGRKSLGPGAPEQIDIGSGLSLSTGSLVANGSDHASFTSTSSLVPGSDIVISNSGTPMLMQADLLRGLFSAGQNIAIDNNGMISSTATSTVSEIMMSSGSIMARGTVIALSALDLVAVNHAGSDYAISYQDFLDGITIDQAPTAGPVGDDDALWVAQDGNVMTSQKFSSIWDWIVGKVAMYRLPVVEITVNTSLNGTAHNGTVLICSESISISPNISEMGNGFHCTVVNASSGNVTLASGFISSSGSFTIPPWQSAKIICLTYSAGTVAFVAMPVDSSPLT